MTRRTRDRLKLSCYIAAAASFVGGIIAAGSFGAAGPEGADPSTVLAIIAVLVLVLPMILVMAALLVSQTRPTEDSHPPS